MVTKETGFFRRHYNYFKRGKSELNFLLNIYQTIILIWGVDAMTNSTNTKLIILTVGFGIAIFTASLLIGRYSLEKVDTSLAYINPFTQDIVLYRNYMARGMHLLSLKQNTLANEEFRNAMEILERWIANE